MIRPCTAGSGSRPLPCQVKENRLVHARRVTNVADLRRLACNPSTRPAEGSHAVLRVRGMKRLDQFDRQAEGAAHVAHGVNGGRTGVELDESLA